MSSKSPQTNTHAHTQAHPPTHMHTPTHTHRRTHGHTRPHTHTQAHTHTHGHTHAHTPTHAHTGTDAYTPQAHTDMHTRPPHTPIHAHACTHTQAHTPTHAHTRTHVHTRTHTTGTSLSSSLSGKCVHRPHSHPAGVGKRLPALSTGSGTDRRVRLCSELCPSVSAWTWHCDGHLQTQVGDHP